MSLILILVVISCINTLSYALLRLNRIRFRRGGNVCVIGNTVVVWVPLLLVAQARPITMTGMLAWMLALCFNLWVYLGSMSYLDRTQD